MNNAVVDNTSLQATESNQIKSAQDQILEELLQAPLNEEGFGQLLAIIDERQRVQRDSSP